MSEPRSLRRSKESRINTSVAEAKIRSRTPLTEIVTQRARALSLCPQVNLARGGDSLPPGTANLLTCYSQNKINYLEAVAASNFENQVKFLTQALATYRALIKMLGRDRLMKETESWDPTQIKKPVVPKPKAKKKPQERAAPQPVASSSQESLGNREPSPPLSQGARMRKRREHRHSIYGEMMRMARSLQGGFQFLEEERAKRAKRG